MTELERLQKQIDVLQETVTKLTNATAEVVKPTPPIQKYKNLRSSIFYKYYPKDFDQRLHMSSLGSLANQLFLMLIPKQTSHPCMQTILFGCSPDSEENTEYIKLCSEIYESLCEITAKILGTVVKEYK